MRNGILLSALVRELPNNRGVEVPGVLVDGVACDSRQVRPGFLFVAVKGKNADGHDYADDAVKRGAIAVVAQRKLQLSAGVPQFIAKDSRRAIAALANAFYRRPSRSLRVVGVTGTNGKTTTCFCIRSIIEAAEHGCGLIGTIHCDTGMNAFASSMTTPDATELQRLLREMVDAGMDHAVMEVSSHALDQRRADFVHFAAGVFTNLQGDHLDYHCTMNAYLEAKDRLFRGLRPGAAAVLNADDTACDQITTPAAKIWYGLRSPEAFSQQKAGGTNPGVPGHWPYLCADNVHSTLEGSRFVLRLHVAPASSPGETVFTAGGHCATVNNPFREGVEISTPLIGEHNVRNALAAVAGAISLGFGPDAVVKGLAAVPVVPGRLEMVYPTGWSRQTKYGRVSNPSLPFNVMVDFAHTHGALDAVLSSLRPLVNGRLIVVFGAGGDRDRTKRSKMGKAVERWADLAWITSDNPRSEDPEKIIAEIAAEIEQKDKFHKVEDRKLAIEQAILAAQPGDLVVVAGKGHETHQKCRDRVIEFDDRVAAREFLDSTMRRPGEPG